MKVEPNCRKLVVLKKASELPFDALEDAKGVLFDGKMYLVAEQILSPEDANEVVFHEFVGHFGLRSKVTGADEVRRTVFHEFVGHFGLQGFFGDRIRPALDRIHVHNPLVRQYTNEWMKDNQD